MRNGNILKMRVSEICVRLIRVNQEDLLFEIKFLLKTLFFRHKVLLKSSFFKHGIFFQLLVNKIQFDWIFEFRHKYNTFIKWIFLNVWLNCSVRFEDTYYNHECYLYWNNFRRSILYKIKRILKGLGIQTSSSFVKIW